MVEITAKCPFCGSNSVQLYGRKKWLGYNGLGDRLQRHKWSVRCNKCHARGPIASGKRFRYYREDMSAILKYDLDLKAEAIRKWNKRANSYEKN